MSNLEGKSCHDCGKSLTHTAIETRFRVVTLEGKVDIRVYLYCVGCGTLKMAEEENGEDCSHGHR